MFALSAGPIHPGPYPLGDDPPFELSVGHGDVLERRRRRVEPGLRVRPQAYAPAAEPLKRVGGLVDAAKGPVEPPDENEVHAAPRCIVQQAPPRLAAAQIRGTRVVDVLASNRPALGGNELTERE